MPRSAADIEELRAIKEVCYKSGNYGVSQSFLNTSVANIVNFGFFFSPLGVCLGEYYGIQHPHNQQSTKAVSSPRANELVSLGATEQDLQKGKYFSSWTMFTTFKSTVSGRKNYTVCSSFPLF